MKEQIMKQMGDIVEFNDWVKQQVGQLYVHGEEVPDLLAYLWNTYLMTPTKSLGITSSHYATNMKTPR